MDFVEILFGILILILSVSVSLLTFLTKNKGKGLSGLIMGSNEQVRAAGKNSLDAKLNKAITINAVTLGVVVLMLNIIIAMA